MKTTTWIKPLARLALIAAATWLLLQLIVGVGLFFEHGWAAIRFPYALDYGEGPLLDQTVRLSHLENIYKRSVDAPPYTISNYPPLFLLIQAPLVRLSGPALWYGRVINIISLVTAALCIGLTIYTIGGDLFAGIAAGLTLLVFPFIIHWSAFNRVDSLALGISCAGLYTATRWGHTRRGVFWSAVLLTASVYTRQSYALAAPFAAFVWLLRGDKDVSRRRAFELAAWVAGMGMSLFLLLNLITGGGFYFNIVTANVNPFRWNTVRDYIEEMWAHIPLLLLAGALYLLVGPWLGKSRYPKLWWVVTPYLLGATASAITVGKSGSSVNYLFEFCAALSLLVGAWIAWPKKLPWLQALLILALAPQTTGIVRWTREGRFNWVMGKIAEVRDIELMAALVHEADSPVLADEYMALVPLAGKPLYYQPFELKQLHLAGIWEEDGFLQDIEDQMFPLLLLYDPPSWNSQQERWTPRQIVYIERYYQVTDRLANTLVYRPRLFKLGY